MIIDTLRNLLTANNPIDLLNEPILYIGALITLILIGYFFHLIGKFIVLNLIKKIILKTETRLDDLLIEHSVISAFIQLGIFSILHSINSKLFIEEAGIHNLNQTLILLIIVFSSVYIIETLLNCGLAIWNSSSVSTKFPGKSFIQALKLVSYFLGIIFVLSVLLGKSPIFFISGLGALTAVLLLVFKDTILGLVSGIQVSANNSINIGDWIEIPEHNTNGTVKDLSLTTLKVENWNQTISSIPMHMLMTNSFKNWRNMSHSGGRRIKRSIIIDNNSINFLNENSINTLKHVPLIKRYLEEKLNDPEISTHNNSIETGQRRLTNIGTFRAYCVEYLKSHSEVNSDMTLIVRQLEPTESGIPLEIWAYSNTTEWLEYERIQSDIFDHLFSTLCAFGLRAYQKPNGLDLIHLSEPKLKVKSSGNKD